MTTKFSKGFKRLIARVILACGILRIYSPFRNESVSILMYHRICPIDSDDVYSKSLVSAHQKAFLQQMEYVKKNCNVVTFDDLEKKLPKNPVIITFDDGYSDNYRFAYPIIKKLGLKATIFLTTGFINSPELPWWDKTAIIVKKNRCQFNRKLKSVSDAKKITMLAGMQKSKSIPSGKGLFLTWQQINEMSDIMNYGAHTCSHPILTRVCSTKAKQEILDSISEIEGRTSQDVRVFCYPNGHDSDMNNNTDDILKSAGIKYAVTCKYGKAKKTDFRMRRIGISYEDNMDIFKVKLSGIGQSLITVFQKWF